MRLISSTIRHYRVHNELRVDFDESRMLIGGPNECGKSTLIEAIHRGLFLRSKVSGDVQKSMVSATFPGVPEVEVAFEAGGHNYQVHKRFSGNNGTTRLIEVGGSTWLGDEAESRLATILGVDAIGGGRGVGDRVSQQWSHLWVWQRQSGNDPTEYASVQHSNLLQRLQASGGATAIQSALDATVATHFEEATESIFARGRAKAGSDLEKAEIAANVADEKLNSATERLGRLRQSVLDFEEASTALERAESDSRQVAAQMSVASTKQAQVEELRRQEALQVAAAQLLARKLADLDQIHGRISRLRGSVETAEVELLPKTAEIQRLSEAYEEIKRRTDLAVREYEAACETTRARRLRHDLASAWLSRMEKAARFDELSKKAGQVQKLDSELSGLRQEIAKLPEIDGPKLKKLQKADNELTSADAALQAMAAGLDILAADRPVVVAGTPLSTGASRVLVDDTDVLIGETIRLRVRPGGGTSLTDARQKAHDTRIALRKSLDAIGVSSVAEAAEIAGRRTDIETKIKSSESTLEGLDAANVASALSEASAASTAADAEVSRRLEQMPDFAGPETRLAANQLTADEAQQLREAEGLERRCKALRDTEGKALSAADVSLLTSRQDIEKQARAIDDLRAQLRLLNETYGTDDVRGRTLMEARSASTTAEELLATTRRTIAELQPDLLAADLARLQRAQNQIEKSRTDDGTKRAISQAALRSDGTDDPEAALALALSQAEYSRAHLAAVRRKADAVRMLHEMFLEEQRALSERFTRPLADKISEYLQCLFGAGARANVVFAENSFSGLQLVRPGQGDGALTFETLSEGAKEQVAAAMRLAIAGVLAEDHGGCLPIVFDDAFAYSDPDRVQTLQRMLDLAATRGLQVVVLTCNPSDYSALGARFLAIQPRQIPVIQAPESVRSRAVGEDEANGSQTVPSSPSVPVSDDQRERLLSALKEAGSKAGNLTLRQAVGWDETTYEAVKDDLVASGKLTPGRGRGGSVSLSEERPIP